MPGNIGTDVRAIADGEVVQLYEETPNNTFGNAAWGNFVLIRHKESKRHWDQTILPDGSLSYVYSLYLHLEENSVDPIVGDNVVAGEIIASRDNTGRSTGSHLHVRVVLHPERDVLLTPNNTLDSENNSRNPELWLSPIPGTGTAIGQVRDTNGNPVSNLVVCGIQKQAPTTGYASSRTYSFTWANPDDIFHENFGTTDVRPGTYSLYAANLSTGCGGAHVYDLGWHTFAFDTATFVGLYPAWLPTVRPSSLWDAQLFIRNHETSRRNVNYTSFYNAGYSIGQSGRNSNPQGTSVVADEPDVAYSGIVVSNQDSSTLLITSRNGQPAGYTGIVATNINNNVNIPSGWERAGPRLYAPLVKKNWNGRWSKIYVANAGIQTTTVYVTYYKNGLGYGGGYSKIEPNTREVFASGTVGLADGIYSAVIISSTNQPLAAIVLEGDGSGVSSRPAAYNAFSSAGNTTLYAPLVKKNYSNSTTGITLQNTSSSSANFEARYYDMNGNQQGQTVVDTISSNSPYVLYNPAQIPDGFLGSIRITSTNGKPLVGQMSEARTTGTIIQLMSNLALGGTATIHLPLWYDNYTATGGNWVSGVNVQNADSGINNITATWFDQAGNPALTQTATLNGTYDTHNFYDTALNNFVGSVVIQSTNGKKIVAVSNILNYAGAAGTDKAMAFNGSNR